MSLPNDLKSFRSDHERVSRLAVVLAFAAMVMLTITVHRMSMTDALGEQLDRTEAVAEYWTSVVAACMRGEAFSWYDPIAEVDKLTVCDTHTIPVVGEKP